MKKLISLTILGLLLLLPASLHAQEDSDLTNKIKERLQETAEEGLETIQAELTTQSNAPQKKAFIGYIQSIEGQTLTLKYKDQTTSIRVNDDTDYSKTDYEDLELEDFIIAMGFLYPGNPALEAHRVSYIEDPETNHNRQLITGKVKEVDGNRVAVDGKVLTITSKTDFSIKDIDSAGTDDLELEDNLFAIVTLDKNGDIDTIIQVLVLPGKNNPASQAPTNIDATESADTATESAEEE